MINECPVSHISPFSAYCIDLFWDCHNVSQGDIMCHVLPDNGSMLDQDNKLMSAFSLIKSEFNQHQKEQLKKEDI